MKMDWSPRNEDGLESAQPDLQSTFNEDGLESAQPDLQSTFKKPGGDPVDPGPWESLHDGRSQSRLKRSVRGRQSDVTDRQGIAEG
jgi:hypothetical protein